MDRLQSLLNFSSRAHLCSIDEEQLLRRVRIIGEIYEALLLVLIVLIAPLLLLDGGLEGGGHHAEAVDVAHVLAQGEVAVDLERGLNICGGNSCIVPQ